MGSADRAKRYMDKKRALYDAARNKPCMDCSNTFPLVCMDLAHTDYASKLFSPSQFSSVGYEKLQAEIAKCVPLCSNCHRIRTHLAMDKPTLTHAQTRLF